MSGYKRATIQVDEEEYRRLHEAEQRLHTLEKNVQKRLTREARENRAILKKQAQAFDDRQQTFNSLVSLFSEQIQYIDQQTHSSLLEQEASLCAALEDSQGALWTEIHDLVGRQNRYFEQLIQEESYQRARENQDLFETVNGLVDDQTRKQQLARSWLDAAQEIFDFISHNYDCLKFAPGLLEHYQRRIWQAQDNLENGVPEGTILDSQQMVAELSEQRILLERQERNWWIMYHAALEWISDLRDQVEDNQTCQALDLDGQPLGISLEVDYWTSGLMSKVGAYLELINNRLENEPDLIDEAALRQFLEVELPQADEALGELVFQARLRALNSQLRINIADIVLLALEEQGFSIQQAGYSDEDMRKDFCASAVNRQGSEILIDVVPTGDAYGMNELHLISKDAESRTEHELNQRTREIARTLQRYGLMIGSLDSPAAAPSPKPAPASQQTRQRRSTAAPPPG
jgi:hypothetical protein